MTVNKPCIRYSTGSGGWNSITGEPTQLLHRSAISVHFTNASTELINAHSSITVRETSIFSVFRCYEKDAIMALPNERGPSS